MIYCVFISHAACWHWQMLCRALFLLFMTWERLLKCGCCYRDLHSRSGARACEIAALQGFQRISSHQVFAESLSTAGTSSRHISAPNSGLSQTSCTVLELYWTKGIHTHLQYGRESPRHPVGRGSGAMWCSPTYWWSHSITLPRQWNKTTGGFWSQQSEQSFLIFITTLLFRYIGTSYTLLCFLLMIVTLRYRFYYLLSRLYTASLGKRISFMILQM